MRAADSLRQIDVYGFSGKGAASAETAPEARLPQLHMREGVDSLATGFGRFISSRVTSVNEENLRRILQGAGFYTLQPARFVGYQALATIALGGFFVWLAFVGSSSPLLSIVMVVAAVM